MQCKMSQLSQADLPSLYEPLLHAGRKPDRLSSRLSLTSHRLNAASASVCVSAAEFDTTI